MRKLLLVFVASGIFFASCNKDAPPPLTKQQIRQQIDSITIARIKESDEQSRKDLDLRMKIEIKVKVDSILNADRLSKTKPDTAQKPKIINAPITIQKQQVPVK
jgi:hypothetical protein